MGAVGDMLRVEGLSKRFGRFQALDGLSFELKRGEVLGFLGRNGAGKSTTIKILCNLLRADAGQAWLDDTPILGTTSVEHRRMIGAVIEAPRFYPQLSGMDNLAQVARLHGVEGERTAEILARVGLKDAAHVMFGHYSMGMRQRLGLAAAFVHKPRLAILDEPTNGLDPVGQRQIRSLIRNLAAEEGGSTLLCSHVLEEVEELCGRALVIDGGRKILDMPLGGKVIEKAAAMGGLRECFEVLASGEPFATGETAS